MNLYQQVDDFLNDETFRDWVFGRNPQAASHWQDWKIQHPEAVPRMEEARDLLLAVRGDLHPVSDERVEELTGAIQGRALAENGEASARPLRGLVGRYWGWAAAAVVAGLLVGWWWNALPVPTDLPALTDPVGQTSAVPLREINNGGKDIQRVELPDGSTVQLLPRSRLSFPKSFANDRRDVYLSGEAFFEVTKRPQQPFFVYANELVTKVLGTSFRIKAYNSDRNVVVTVATGRVSVYARTRPENKESAAAKGLVLIPNQRAVYVRDMEQLHRDLIERPVQLLPAEQRPLLEFENAPVAEVFRVLEKTYGITVVFDEDVLKDCTLTASLGDDTLTLYQKLDMICKTLRLRYELLDAQVVVTGQPCS